MNPTNSNRPRFATQLHRFLNTNGNSRHREAMMRHQLMHDLHLTFARFGQGIQIYEPEVDSFGYDIIIDNLQRTSRIQLKTKLSTAPTAKWDVHKILLRPDLDSLNRLPFCPDSGGHGYMGGVILTIAEVEASQVHYRYLYTDALVICAMHYGINAPTRDAQLRAVTATYKKLTEPDYNPRRITLHPPCFWSFPSLRPIMALAGFDLGYGIYFRHALLETIERLSRRSPGPHSAAKDQNSIHRTSQLLRQLTDQP